MTDLFAGLPLIEASAQNGFAGNRIDRRSDTRGPQVLAEALADPRAAYYLFSGDKAVLHAGERPEPLFPPQEAFAIGALADTSVLLGWSEDGPRLAAVIGELPAEAAGLALHDIRALAVEAALSAEHLGAVAQGRALCHWHARHGFCANCGAATRPAIAGYRRDCGQCGAQHFPRTDPVTIMLVVDGDRCVMGRQARFVANMYSCLAGFVEPGETIEAAVRREVREEAGIACGRVRYHSSQPWPFPSSLMIGCHAEAASFDIHRDEEELEDCRWFDRAEVAAMLDDRHPSGLKTPPPMAIAHRLIRAWVEAG